MDTARFMIGPDRRPVPARCSSALEVAAGIRDVTFIREHDPAGPSDSPTLSQEEDGMEIFGTKRWSSVVGILCLGLATACTLTTEPTSSDDDEKPSDEGEDVSLVEPLPAGVESEQLA